MKKFLIRAALAGGFFACVRMLPGFSIFWSNNLSLPVLRLLAAIGDSTGAVLAEWLALPAALYLGTGLFRRRLLRRLLRMGALCAGAYFFIWYPLYFLPVPEYAASPAQLATLSTELIDALNAAPPDFSALPPMPAKFARFPGWMDALGIDGICTFFSGEALVSPDLSAVNLPFVAVHERMHLLGIADEGAANIAAWQECMRRGGAFAGSARIRALRYAMGLLHADRPELYRQCLERMQPHTLRLYRESGGAYRPPRPVLLSLTQVLGISRQLNNYEMLALQLAAGLPE